MSDDWIDKAIDGEPKEAELWQLAYIESKLHYTSISLSEQSSILRILNGLSEEEAKK